MCLFAAILGSGGRGPPGRGGFGRVYWGGLSDPVRQLLSGNDEFVKLDADLAAKTAKLGADRFGTVASARRLAAIVADAKPPADGGALVRGLKLADRDLGLFDWDDAAQTYYALRAANRGRTRDDPGRKPDDADAALAELAKMLTLPRGKEVVNSPVGFGPAAVAPKLKDVAAKLEKWYDTRAKP